MPKSSGTVTMRYEDADPFEAWLAPIREAERELDERERLFR